MIIYIILYIFVIINSILLGKCKNKKIKYILSLILLLGTSVVAGIRSIDMGWDASKYVVSTFFRLEYFNGDLSKFLDATTVEIGFSIYSWILYKLYSNINFLMFGYSFLTTLFVLIFAFKEKDNIPITKLLIIYFFTLYLISYNIIRQSISVVIILTSLSYYKDKKYIKGVFLFVLATFFHNSAVFAIPIYFLYTILEKSKTNVLKFKKGCFIAACTLILCIFYGEILEIIYNIGLIPLKYYNYFLDYDKIDYNISNIIINAYWIFFAIIVTKVNTDEKKYNELIFNFVILIIALIINIISIKIHPIYRIGYYYYYIGVFSFIPILSKYIKNDKSNKRMINLLIYGAILVMFLWMTVLGNGHNIYPYQSEILNSII